MRDARRTVGQGSQIAFGAAASKVFEHGAARIHDRHHDGRECFAEHKSSRHRNEGDRVDPEATDPEVANDGDNEHGHNRNGCGCPDETRLHVTIAETPDGQSDRQPDQRKAEQRATEQWLVQDTRCVSLDEWRYHSPLITS